MKKILLVTILIFALAFTFAACDDSENPEEQCQHTFSSEWSKDATNHWHKATCEHTDEVDGEAPHSFKTVVEGNIEKCDICGYTRSAISKPEPPHEHTYKSEYASNEYSHWLETTCGHDVDNAAPHGFVDGICSTCGWWSSATEVLLANLSKSDVWNYAVVLDNVRVDGVNLLSEGLDHAEITVSGELQVALSADGKISGSGYLQAGETSYMAVVSENTVYAVGNGNCIRCELDKLLLQNGIDVQAYVDELNANTQQIREYVDELKQSVGALPIDGVLTDGLLTALVKLDESKSTDNLKAYVVDYDVLKAVNEALATVTVQQYVDTLLAQLDGTPLGVLLGNSFEALPNRVRTLLTQRIATTVFDLWNEEFTLDDLLEQINSLIVKYYPDERINNLDELAAAMGVDLKGFTVKQTIMAASILSPETIWNNMQQEDDKKISAVEISEKLTEWCDAYGDKTVYQIAAQGSDELTDEYIKLFVDEIASMLEECLSVEFYIDNDGILQQITISVVDSEEQQLFESFSGTITLKRDYVSEQDYSQIIEQVEAFLN